MTGWGVTTTATVAAKLDERDVDADVLETGINPSAETITNAAPAGASTPTRSCITTSAAWKVRPARQHAGGACCKAGKPVVVVALRDAYDIDQYPEVPSYLATYSSTTVAWSPW